MNATDYRGRACIAWAVAFALCWVIAGALLAFGAFRFVGMLP